MAIWNYHADYENIHSFISSHFHFINIFHMTGISVIVTSVVKHEFQMELLYSLMCFMTLQLQIWNLQLCIIILFPNCLTGGSCSTVVACWTTDQEGPGA